MSAESKEKDSLTVGFGDTILLPHDTIGTVRFIGYTEFKKNIIFYGIHLKEAIGKNNGSFGNRKYFKCTKSHGIFTEKKNIVDILKKHSISASFHYGQTVQIINSTNNNTIGKGLLRYIGLTKYDNYKNYYYGVKLDVALTQKEREAIKDNQHIKTIKDKNKYFDADPKQSVFVRQNQLRCIASKSFRRKKKVNNRKDKKPRAQSMLPQSKSLKKKRTEAVKKRKSMKAKTGKKNNKLKIPNSAEVKSTKSNTKKGTSKKEKNNKETSKKGNKNKETSAKKKNTSAKKKRKKIKQSRELRKIQSDLGQIRENMKKPKKIQLSASKNLGTEFNGCLSPTKTPKSAKKGKKKKGNKSKKENVNPNITTTKSVKQSKKSKPIKTIRKRSTSTITIDAKYMKNKKNSAKIPKRRRKKNKAKDANEKQTRSKSMKPKKKPKKAPANRERMMSADDMSYDHVINTEDLYHRYVDNKNFYYHQQFTKQHKKDKAQIIVDRIRKRSVHAPPPTVGSYFSQRSRANQRKKRRLPTVPHVYSIMITSRPMGFFIETKKLYTILENKDGEEVTEQVEIVDKDNKFNKMNAYISMIQAEEWQNVLVVGSQLLTINGESITGLSFGDIFQKLSSHPLPFSLELAAPIADDNDSPLLSPNDDDDDEDDEESGPVNHSIRLTRGQTFDETKAVRTERKKRFRFQLF